MCVDGEDKFISEDNKFYANENDIYTYVLYIIIYMHVRSAEMFLEEIYECQKVTIFIHYINT